MDDDKDIVIRIRRAAVDALARREHSGHELSQKLLRKFPGCDSQVSSVIAQLTADGVQSDRRYVENYLSSRSRRGYGPKRILLELGQKGAIEEAVDDVLGCVVPNWQQLMQQQYRKKFGEAEPASAEVKAKVLRFFLYRGFSHAQIQELLKSFPFKTSPNLDVDQ